MHFDRIRCETEEIEDSLASLYALGPERLFVLLERHDLHQLGPTIDSAQELFLLHNPSTDGQRPACVPVSHGGASVIGA